MAKLDKTRDFGEITGGDTQARFFQDGIFFDAHGEELPGQVKPKPAKAKKEVVAEAAPVAENDQVAAQMGEDFAD